MKNDFVSNEQIKNAWDTWSDDYYSNEYRNIDLIKKAPYKVFPTNLLEKMNWYYPDFKGLKICVPSSGDNKAVFAFHLLGAELTSCDFSANQINNARKIAESNGWNINFKVLDSMDLSSLDAQSYDLVYTSNGVHVWISDLPLLYKGFHRILKKEGRYIFFETHPFCRPFDDSTNDLRIVKSYETIEVSGELPKYHWRVQDFVNSMIASGFKIEGMDEFFAERNTIGANWWNEAEWDEKADINKNPYAALPQWISFCAVK